MMPASKMLSAVSAIALALTPAVGGAIVLTAGAVSTAEAAVVRTISVRGNTRVSAGTVADIIGFSAGKNYSAADVDDAVKTLFATGLFADVDVYPSGSVLVVEVSELSIVNQVIFRGNRKNKDDRLRSVVRLQPRGTFDQATLDADVDAIREAYSRIGRADVNVYPEVVDLGENRVNIVFQIDEGDRTKISQINFVGNNAFSDRRLQSVITTKRTNPLSWLMRNDVYDDQRLAADEEMLRRFYFNHGYADFRILSSAGDVDPNTGNIVVTIEVDEGERYTFGSVEIDSTVSGVSSDDLRRTISTRSGSVYSAENVEDTLIDMSENLAGNGFPFAEVTPVGNRNFENRTIDITYVVDQGQRAFIERIEIVGNARTRDYVIRREFDLSEGDAFNKVLLRRAQKRLEALNYFERVDIQTRPGSAPDRVVLVVNAVDKSTGEFGIGAGYTTGDSGGISVEASVVERNFLGRGQTVRVSAGGGVDNRTYDISFTEPYFLGYRLAVTGSAFRRTKDTDNYNLATQGGSVSFGLPITEDLMANFGYKFSQDEYSDLDCPGDTPTSICTETSNGADATWTKSAAFYGLTYNTIDSAQDPHEGLLLRFKQEFAGIGGDAQYVSSTFDGRYFKTLSESADLVGMIKVGAGNITGLGKDVRTLDHFQLGTQHIRGFAHNGIGPTEVGGTDHVGGKTYFHATAEAQFPIPAVPRALGLKGSVFADTATLFGHDADPADVENTGMEWRASAGVGLIWQSPFAPLRFDYAVPLAKEESDKVQKFNFSVSTAF
ncbi:MAG: outer membrane protein assembly factor BamA [Oricola sp.]|nr:outer membrane protein assembly factor BamA [Oricola sp.]MCI5076985.1 outer membrane protein assembly factor BamA [Oricola sp.]